VERIACVKVLKLEFHIFGIFVLYLKHVIMTGYVCGYFMFL
jgi:hypothetical protein